MIGLSGEERRRAFAVWLRTGRRPAATPDGIELKFNPYHDPRNGQFTFAPGGPQSLSKIVISDRDGRRLFREEKPLASTGSTVSSREISGASTPTIVGPNEGMPSVRPSFEPEPAEQSRSSPPARAGLGHNQRAFYDPVVLAQVFPGLQTAPGAAIIALADNALGLSATAAWAAEVPVRNIANALVNDIKRIDPKFRHDTLGFPQTIQGQTNLLNHLRMERAAAYLRARGDVRPLQVETIRFVQERTDFHYGQGLILMGAGSLPTHPKPRTALGNFVDQMVRRDLRRRYNQYGIDSAGRGPVRVNRRENLSSEGTYRQPDSRIGRLAIDVTLAPKTLNTTPQVGDFFRADFQPKYVAIIRPRQLGPESSYIITRPETQR